jgi:curved DNA-binding protein CbpA
MNRVQAYHVLGLPEDASREELRSQYRALAQIFHPDRHVDGSPKVQENAAIRMKELTAAYDLLIREDAQGSRTSADSGARDHRESGQRAQAERERQQREQAERERQQREQRAQAERERQQREQRAQAERERQQREQRAQAKRERERQQREQRAQAERDRVEDGLAYLYYLVAHLTAVSALVAWYLSKSVSGVVDYWPGGLRPHAFLVLSTCSLGLILWGLYLGRKP